MHDSLPYILIGLLIALSPLINKIFLNYKIPLTTFLKNAAEKYQIIKTLSRVNR